MPSGQPTADAVAGAMVATTLVIASALDRGWVREIGGVVASVSEIPAPTLNGVWTVRADATAEDMIAGLDAVAEHDLPHSLEARPTCAAAAAAVAADRGLVVAEETCLMATARRAGAPFPDDLVVRELAPDEARLHWEVAAPAFEAPIESFAALVTARVLALAEVRGYAGEVAGVPVVTAMSATVGDGVGLFNIATALAHRRRGYGAAVTARAVTDGLAAGASWAWLQAGEEGRPVYEALGFTTLERWPSWVTPD